MDQAHADSIATVQQQFTDVGINAEVLAARSARPFRPYYYNNAEFDVMLAGFGVSPDMDEFSRCFMSDAFWPAGQNAMKYVNPKVDELFLEAARRPIEARRKTAYNEVQVILPTSSLDPLLQPEARRRHEHAHPERRCARQCLEPAVPSGTSKSVIHDGRE